MQKRQHVLSLMWLGWALAVPIAMAQGPRAVVDFQTEILPLLADHCFECHGPDDAARQADVRLNTKAGAFGSLDGGRRIIAPGAPLESELYLRVASRDDRRMPPPDAGEPLTSEQVQLIEHWIRQGAPWHLHWSLVPPDCPELPVPGEQGLSGNPIDLFVQAKLGEMGLEHSLQADRRTLIRRVTLDLTGLPPTPDEVAAFLEDDAPDAYERLVDRLFASPRYGERMAMPWLDAARYADTHGYLFDTERTMWPWRDWVIDSLNSDQPYDAFTIEQLAGDLLPDSTESQRIATGFNRNHLINNEAGATPEEYLVENVVDRVNTTATVWMGLSLACCQCHDHKYDPFTQREYYQLYAFFNTLPELGLDGLNSNARPLMKAPALRDRDALDELQRHTAQAEASLKRLGESIEAGQRDWEASVSRPADSPTSRPVGHWTFDGSLDDSQSDRAAVFEAAPASYTAGILGDAAVLEGLGYVNAGDRFPFSAEDSFSLAAWVRTSTKEGRLSVFSRMADGKELFRGYALQIVAGLPAFFLVHRFPDDMIQVQGKEVLEPNRWHHLTVTYDGTGKAPGVKLYVDGELQERGLVVDKLSGSISTDRPFWIGNGHPGAKLKGFVDEVQIYDCELAPEEIKLLPGLTIESLLAVEVKERNEEQARRIREFYLSKHAPSEWREPYETLRALQEQTAERERAVPTVMIMQEAAQPRETRILVRGAYDKPGERVEAGTPAMLPPLADGLPKNRLGLARWLVDPGHPLTARVAVNRCWQMFFGRGLVVTTEDLGVQGERPTHPELLDWLASEFVRRRWDVKSLQRLIVTSATYRQSSRAAPQLLQADPENRWLARGPRKRLPGELIRDQALFASGLLVDTIGGPSVKPYQPEGLWREVAFDFSGANLTAQIYTQDSGANLYRRSLYTFWKRTAPPPSMQLFDAPDRERCVVRREQTGTPLQALVLMNDPTYLESSRKLAERVMSSQCGDSSQRIAAAFSLLLAREPSETELPILVRLFEQQQERFRRHPEAADQLLAVGESPWDKLLDKTQLAAYTLVANVLLNLDETITVR